MYFAPILMWSLQLFEWIFAAQEAASCLSFSGFSHGSVREKAALRHAGTAGLFFPTPLRKSMALQGRYAQACRRRARDVPPPPVLSFSRAKRSKAGRASPEGGAAWVDRKRVSRSPVATGRIPRRGRMRSYRRSMTRRPISLQPTSVLPASMMSPVR